MLPLILLSSMLLGGVLAQEASSQAASASAPPAESSAAVALAAARPSQGEGRGEGARAGTGSRSSVPFGQALMKCADPNDFALSFDDGPFDFTQPLLQMLKENNLKATFFVNGQNFGSITDKGDVLKQMLDEGHQIGSHTFSHPNLSSLTAGEVRNEMTMLDVELQKLIGMTPTYMRPPFFEADDETLQVLGEMQYHVIDADVDTKDFEKNTPETNDEAFETFKKELAQGGTISLMHDVQNTTVNQLIPNVIPVLKQSGRKSVTVGECMGDAPANWYRSGAEAGPGAGPAPAGGSPNRPGKKGGDKGGKGRPCGCGRKPGTGDQEGRPKGGDGARDKGGKKPGLDALKDGIQEGGKKTGEIIEATKDEAGKLKGEVGEALKPKEAPKEAPKEQPKEEPKEKPKEKRASPMKA